MTQLQVVLVVALLAWTIVRRMVGQPLRQGRLVVLPLIMLVWGGSAILTARPSAAELGLLAVELAVSVGIGVLRGMTIHLFVRDGYLWMRYRWSTLGLWLLSAGVRVGFLVAASAIGPGLDAGPTLLLGLGTSLLGEAIILAPRAQRMDAPFAPRGARRRAGGLAYRAERFDSSRRAGGLAHRAERFDSSRRAGGLASGAERFDTPPGSRPHTGDPVR